MFLRGNFQLSPFITSFWPPPCLWRCWWAWHSRPRSLSAPESRPCYTPGRSAPPGVRPDLLNETKPDYLCSTDITQWANAAVCFVHDFKIRANDCDILNCFNHFLNYIFQFPESYIICLHWFCLSSSFLFYWAVTLYLIHVWYFYSFTYRLWFIAVLCLYSTL